MWISIVSCTLYLQFTEAAVPKKKAKPVILEKGKTGTCFTVHNISNYVFSSNYNTCILFLLIEQEVTPRNVSLAKGRVKIVPMKKGNLLLFKCFIGYRCCIKSTL